MIDNLSSAAALYLAPVLSLTSFLLSLFAFLAPVVILQKQVALLVISPSSALTSTTQTATPDGPTLRLGVLGSCGQSNNAGPLNCTTPSFSPFYDTSVLPESSDPEILSALPASAPVSILVALLLLTLFFFLFTGVTVMGRFGKFSAVVNKPLYSRIAAWLGLLGFMIGMTAYLVLRMWYGKMADDFNQGIEKQGSHGPQLVASIGNSFTMIWVAHAFAAVPLVYSMTKLHVATSGGDGKA